MARSRSTRNEEVSRQLAENAVNSALYEISQSLKEKGLSLEKLIELGREIRSEIEEEYGLTD